MIVYGRRKASSTTSAMATAPSMVGDHSGHKIDVSIAGEANVHALVHRLIAN